MTLGGEEMGMGPGDDGGGLSIGWFTMGALKVASILGKAWTSPSSAFRFRDIV